MKSNPKNKDVYIPPSVCMDVYSLAQYVARAYCKSYDVRINSACNLKRWKMDMLYIKYMFDVEKWATKDDALFS